MPITQQEQTKPCEMSIEIEVEQDAVKQAFNDAYRELGKHAEVPGFRKGKAPRSILEKYLSEERIRETAANKLVMPAYENAVKETGIEPFGDAEYEVIHLEDEEPFKFKAKVPLPPSVELGDYVGIEVDKIAQVVSDEHVDAEIDRILQRMAKVESVEDRPAQTGDLLIVQIASRGKESTETVIEVGKNLPSLDEGLVGMNKGETKTIDLVYPDDYADEELKGTTSHATVTISDIKERQIPEMNDELVKEISENSGEKLETVDELKTKIRESMEKASADLADRQVESQLVEKIVEKSTICFPEHMLDHEVAHRLQDLLADLEKRKMTLEDYLQATNSRFEDIRSKVEQAAEKDIKISLALAEVAKKENLEVSEEDIDAEIAKMAEETGYPAESVKAYIDHTNGRDGIGSRVERNKVLDFLVHASNIKNVGKSAS